MPEKLPNLPESLLPREHNLYRPRHSPRQRVALVLAVLFFATPGLLLVVGVRPAHFENRELAAFPSITDGWGFITGFGPWADDHIPFRDVAVSAADGISRGLFGEPAPQQTRKGDLGGPVQPPTDPSLDKPDPVAFARVVEGKEGWLYLGADVQQACEPLVPLEEVFARVNRLRLAVESSGRKFVFVVAPNKSTMEPDHLPAKYFGKACHQATTERFWSRVVDATGAIDIRDELRTAAEQSGGPVYTRKDSHWDNRGGIVMARAVVDAVSPGTSRTWKPESNGPFGRTGDLSRLLGRPEKDEFEAFSLKPDGEEVRSRNLDGDEKQPQRSTQSPIRGVVDTKVGLLGDSFTFAGAKYLVAGFTDITVQHTKALAEDPFQVGRMFAENEVVVLEVAERNLVGGVDSVLNGPVLDAITRELAKQPR